MPKKLDLSKAEMRRRGMLPGVPYRGKRKKPDFARSQMAMRMAMRAERDARRQVVKPYSGSTGAITSTGSNTTDTNKKKMMRKKY